jgi:hypothetical protein
MIKVYLVVGVLFLVLCIFGYIFSLYDFPPDQDSVYVIEGSIVSVESETRQIAVTFGTAPTELGNVGDKVDFPFSSRTIFESANGAAVDLKYFNIGTDVMLELKRTSAGLLEITHMWER